MVVALKVTGAFWEVGLLPAVMAMVQAGTAPVLKLTGSEAMPLATTTKE